MKKKPCQRCGLHYNHKAHDQCPHCGHLDERGLQALLERREAEFQSRKSIGMVFFILALITAFLMLVVAVIF